MTLPLQISSMSWVGLCEKILSTLFLQKDSILEWTAFPPPQDKAVTCWLENILYVDAHTVIGSWPEGKQLEQAACISPGQLLDGAIGHQITAALVAAILLCGHLQWWCCGAANTWKAAPFLLY